jgi:hypothetical protein
MLMLIQGASFTYQACLEVSCPFNLVTQYLERCPHPFGKLARDVREKDLRFARNEDCSRMNFTESPTGKNGISSVPAYWSRKLPADLQPEGNKVTGHSGRRSYITNSIIAYY